MAITACRHLRRAPNVHGILGLALAIAAIAAIALPAFAGGPENWVQQSPATVPPGRVYSTAAFDAAYQNLVLFGGQPLVGQPDVTTWLRDGANWTAYTPVPSPPARSNHAMAYDAAYDQVVLFGGISYPGGVFEQDTWVWHGSSKTWTQLSPATSPSARYNHSMAYDAARGQIVLFGGDDNNTELNDTWTWDGTNSTWTPLDPAARLSPRELQKMTYDAARQEIVLFGGAKFIGGFQSYADTWTWNGTTWTPKSPTTIPLDRYNHAMAYDATQSQDIMFGGVENSNETCGADTWSWNGTNWTQLAPATTPPCAEANPMEYDAAVSHIVLFGTIGSPTVNDTWYFGSTSTTAVTITVPAGLQFTLAGTTYTGAQTVNLTPGVYTLSTPAVQPTGAGTQAAFASWSDAGAEPRP